MGELTEAGCVAFSQAEAPLTDTGVLLRAMQYAATFGHRVVAAPAGSAISRKGGVAHDGEVATRLGLAGDSTCRRDDRARDDLRARPRHRRAAFTCAGCRPADGVAMVRAAKREGCR